MTELPPIIERLDAQLERARAAGQSRVEEFAYLDLYGAYDKLRAELLRLQEERDRAEQQRDYENEERRTSVALLDEAYRQNCALLEALKRIADSPDDGRSSVLLYAIQEAREAIANVEGQGWLG